MLAGVAAVLIWAAAPTLIKIGLADAPVIAVLMLRYLLSVLFGLAWSGSLRKWFRAVPRYLWPRLLLWSALTVCTQTFALSEVPASWYTVFFATSPVFTLLLLRTKWSHRLTISLLMASAGALVFAGASGFSPYPSMLSIAALVISLAAWVGMTQTMVDLHQALSDIGSSMVINYSVALVVACIWLGNGAPWFVPLPAQWIAIAATALLMPFAMFLFSYALRGAPIFGICAQYLEIAFGLGVSAIYWHESFGTLQLVGASLVVAALVLLGWRTRDTSQHVVANNG